MSPRQVVQKVANVLTILAFFAALWLVWAARLLHRGESPCLNENRLLAAAPDFRATPLAELPKKIEVYVQDHLPYRAEFIKCHTFLKHWCLGLRSESVVIGKDGFLFYDRDGCQTLDYMGQAPLTAEQLALWKLYLERRQAYLAARSCRYLFVIAPNAASVYPEKLPDHIAANQGTTRREQLLRYLAEQSSTVEILDLVPALRDAKRLGPTFYRADSHWSGFGCQVALQEICARLHAWFPEVQPQLLSTHYELKDMPASTFLWFMLLGSDPPIAPPPESTLVRCRPPVCRQTVAVLPGDWSQPDLGPSWVPIMTDKSGPGHRLLVLGDSFMGAGVSPTNERPLGDCFQHALFHGNSSPGRIPQSQLESIVYQERPDVVIEETTERSILAPPYAAAIAPEERQPGGLMIAGKPQPRDR
jgi:hypothetical protein